MERHLLGGGRSSEPDTSTVGAANKRVHLNPEMEPIGGLEEIRDIPSSTERAEVFSMRPVRLNKAG